MLYCTKAQSSLVLLSPKHLKSPSAQLVDWSTLLYLGQVG